MFQVRQEYRNNHHAPPGKYITRWWSCATFVGCLLACPQQNILDHWAQKMQNKVWQRMHGVIKGMRRPRSPTRKRSPSHKGKREHLSCWGQVLPRNQALSRILLCHLPYFHQVNLVNEYSFYLWIIQNHSEFVFEANSSLNLDELSYPFC